MQIQYNCVTLNRTFQGNNVNVLLLATIDREKLSYKSVSHIPVCPRRAAKVWLYGHGHTNFCVFY